MMINCAVEIFIINYFTWWLTAKAKRKRRPKNMAETDGIQILMTLLATLH